MVKSASTVSGLDCGFEMLKFEKLDCGFEMLKFEKLDCGFEMV